jgi:hypothetical protein
LSAVGCDGDVVFVGASVAVIVDPVTRVIFGKRLARQTTIGQCSVDARYAARIRARANAACGRLRDDVFINGAVTIIIDAVARGVLRTCGARSAGDRLVACSARGSTHRGASARTARLDARSIVFVNVPIAVVINTVARRILC